MTVQAYLCGSWLETPKTGFLASWLIWFYVTDCFVCMSSSLWNVLIGLSLIYNASIAYSLLSMFLSSGCLLEISFMHQSFVTTAPPPTGKGGDYDFSAFSALL